MNKFATFMRESGPARALIPIGLILIIFGIIAFSINNKNKNYIEVESTVTNVVVAEEGYTDTDGNYVETTYNVTVKYDVNDQSYEATLDNVGKYKNGDKIKIYYNPKDPNQITMTKSLLMPIILIIGGVVALFLGIVSAVNAIKKHGNMKEQEKKWEEKND